VTLTERARCGAREREKESEDYGPNQSSSDSKGHCAPRRSHLAFHHDARCEKTNLSAQISKCDINTSERVDSMASEKIIEKFNFVQLTVTKLMKNRAMVTNEINCFFYDHFALILKFSNLFYTFVVYWSSKLYF